VVYGVAILLVMMVEPLGLYGRWLKTRLYFQLWPFR
jgi:branched-chain amino acid transport system permease protein